MSNLADSEVYKEHFKLLSTAAVQQKFTLSIILELDKMKSAILLFGFLVQGIIGLPFLLPTNDVLRRHCSYPSIFIPYKHKQCGRAVVKHKYLPFGVSICLDSKCSLSIIAAYFYTSFSL